MGRKTSTRTRTGARKARRALGRSIALFPFRKRKPRDELWEFENVLVYGIQEMLGLLGRVCMIDLYPYYLEAERARRPANGKGEDLEGLLTRSEASCALTGAMDAELDPGSLRIDRVRAELELMVFQGAHKERHELVLEVENAGPADRPAVLALPMDDLVRIHRKGFEWIKRTLGWRFCAGADRRPYYDYRLRNPMTRSYDAYRHFVHARRMTHNREEKLVHYKKALRYDPCVGQAYRNIGYLYKESKRLRSAVDYYRRAVENLIDGETLADAYAELGLCAANLNDIDEALVHWHRSRRWNPRNKDVYANLAIGYEEKGMTEKAIRYFTSAQRIDPNYYWACRGLGRIYAGRREWTKAIEQLRLQLKIAPEDAWGHYTLGSCYYHHGDAGKARDHFRRAVELDPHGDAGRRAFQLLMEIED